MPWMNSRSPSTKSSVGELELGLPAQVVKDQVLRLAGEVADAEEDQLDRSFSGVGEW